MKDITLEQIGAGIAFIVAILTGVATINSKLKTWLKSSLKESFETVDKKIDGLKEQIKTVDLEQTKSFLVRFLADVEQGKKIDEIEKERFWEQYEHYRDMNGNTYIKKKVEKLEQEGKL